MKKFLETRNRIMKSIAENSKEAIEKSKTKHNKKED